MIQISIIAHGERLDEVAAVAAGLFAQPVLPGYQVGELRVVRPIGHSSPTADCKVAIKNHFKASKGADKLLEIICLIPKSVNCFASLESVQRDTRIVHCRVYSVNSIWCRLSPGDRFERSGEHTQCQGWLSVRTYCEQARHSELYRLFG